MCATPYQMAAPRTIQNTDMRRLTMRTWSEKWVVRRFCHRANVTQSVLTQT